MKKAMRFGTNSRFSRKEVNFMANVDLTQYGITGTPEIVYNPSYEELFAEETKPRA